MPIVRSIHRYGWRPQYPDWRDRKFTAVAPVGSLPKAVDLRPQDSPIYDQLQTGSCTGNSTAAAIQFARRKEGLTDIEPSRAFAYWNGRAAEGDTDQDGGAQIRDVIKGVATFGICPESEWPLSVDTVTTRPSDQCFADALKERVVQYDFVPQVATSVKSCLASGFPMVFGFTVYESFEEEGVANTGVMTFPDAAENIVGGHAVMAVGYDDDKQHFIVRNSWGPSWGDKGYFYMPYNYLLNSDLASDFWKIELVSK